LEEKFVSSTRKKCKADNKFSKQNPSQLFGVLETYISPFIGDISPFIGDISPFIGEFDWRKAYTHLTALLWDMQKRGESIDHSKMFKNN
jgi:hypothetical protein